MNSQSLYQRVLGADYAKLPLILQQFHSLPEGGCAAGIIAVEQGEGVLRHLAASILRLPKAGGKIPLRLQVVPQDDREVWIRHFDGQRLETLQWQEGSCLVEKAGPLCFVFQLTADEHGLTFLLHSSRMRGIRIPDRMALRVNAHARGMEDRWRIEVTITAPLLGIIATYKGEIVPQSC